MNADHIIINTMELEENYQLVVGLEIHSQINNPSKLFSRAQNLGEVGTAANTTVTRMEFGIPGVLPVVNRGPVIEALKAGLAFNGEVNRTCFFDRKHYFYPDLPWGYQITQYYVPLIKNAYLDIKSKDGKKRVGINMHIESDAGKNIHEKQFSLLDYNRANVGLIESVTEPVLNSIEEVLSFAQEFHRIMVYTQISKGDMEKGNFRIDVNISVKDLKNNKQSNRCEIKNLNSFNNIKRALMFEYKRHVDALKNNEIIPKATLLFNAQKGETRVLRLKENTGDYMHIRDNDLPPLVITEDMLEEARAKLKTTPLPSICRQLLVNKYGLLEEESYQITDSKNLFNYFVEVCDFVKQTKKDLDEKIFKQIYFTIVYDMASLSNKFGNKIWESSITYQNILDLLEALSSKRITVPSSKKILEILWNNAGSVNDVIIKEGLEQILDEGFIKSKINEVLEKNKEDIKKINDIQKVKRFLIGQVIKATEGKVSYDVIDPIMTDFLSKI